VLRTRVSYSPRRAGPVMTTSASPPAPTSRSRTLGRARRVSHCPTTTRRAPGQRRATPAVRAGRTRPRASQPPERQHDDEEARHAGCVRECQPPTSDPASRCGRQYTSTRVTARRAPSAARAEPARFPGSHRARERS
jgi:hypothetical protein